MPSLEYLRPFARSPQDLEKIEAMIKHKGSTLNASREINVTDRRIRRRIAELKSYADADLLNEATTKRISSLTDHRENIDGDLMLRWHIKDKSMMERINAARAVIDAMKSDIKPEKRIAPPKQNLAQLLNLYVITDYHVGMLAWAEECGEDWDVSIAENLLVKWFEYIIARSPDSEHAIFAQLGDFLHFDGLDSVTPTSGHLLDADTRFTRIIRIAIRVLRRVINMLLKKHKTLHIIMAEGNHDQASSAWLREWFAVLYEDNPRVTVDTSPDPYYCHEWGNTSLFFHHGHKKRPASSDTVFAAKFREVWGRTKYSFAHFGHLHHVSVKETNLMVIEQHRTLAAKDSYASRGGWISGREANCITYHKEFGYSSRVVATPEMVQS